jgi:hypothetical protein
MNESEQDKDIYCVPSFYMCNLGCKFLKFELPFD